MKLRKNLTGCIEDRTFFGVEGGELNQVPGADLFFTIAADICLEPSSEPRLSESVASDVSRLQKQYSVHNDDAHGGEFDGCGFAAKLVDIAQELVDNFDEIFAGTKLDTSYEKRAIELTNSLKKLIDSGYFDKTGGELVQMAVEQGANLVTYTGEHTADNITLDPADDSTYDSADANNPDTVSKTSFNLDLNHARNRASEFLIDPDDSEILAQLLALATVRILSNQQITRLHTV